MSTTTRTILTITIEKVIKIMITTAIARDYNRNRYKTY